MSRWRPLAFALTALAAVSAAHAQPAVADLQVCRQLADATKRLACYDALPLPATPPIGPVAAQAAAPIAAVAVPPAAPADPVAKFGQESVKPTAAAPELKQIDSRIVGKFQGWGPNTRIELENGQVWRVVDGSSAYYDLQDPKVIVHRGMLGAFYLEIEGVGFQVKVARVR
ncbi:hypothetical protein [Pelomonas cellulosilytica]|uniref:Uncharacterized protein n=1 Tax=Pelomonas cellulosilytica TaxID=2906762 RepID=A0ABS8XSF7_9BURK|nr:hypothetical protein [Pelomonas sp. P8]MCE4553756.1 hypothetical protein [Pelomonas sp. P8]